MQEIAVKLAGVVKKGGRIFVCGNGGSAATASHFVCDLSKGVYLRSGVHVPAMALNDNVPLLTAWSNDVAYSEAFRQRLASFVRQGDAVVAISASGRSQNVIQAIDKGQETYRVGLTGMGGGFLVDTCNDSIVVESENYGVIEDVHLAICHMLAAAMGEILEGEHNDRGC